MMNVTIVRTATGEEGLLSIGGGVVILGDGDIGIVTYDSDIVSQYGDGRTVDVSCFDSAPSRLVTGDGTPVDDTVLFDPPTRFEQLDPDGGFTVELRDGDVED